MRVDRWSLLRLRCAIAERQRERNHSMRRKALGLLGLLVLNVVLGGCAKCGGFDKFNLPWSASVCDEDPKPK
jgi:hypothetical protein